VIELFDQIVRRADAGEALAVCTLVRTRGSTPQKAGAVMVVLRDGKTLGTIGGGCVEAEVRTRALRLFDDAPGARLLTFKLDHDYGWDDGLVCGGVMDVAVQVIASAAGAGNFRRAREELSAGRGVTVPVTVTDEMGKQSIFEPAFGPTPTLVIAGAGHVGAALAGVARQMDFAVTVVDDRPDLLAGERFAGCACLAANSAGGGIEGELSRIPLDEQSYVVIVTRGHRNDAAALRAVVNSDARYIGLIGSKRKVLTIFEDLLSQGVTREKLARVRAPIGLDIGAVTPGEIAVSIAAELVAVRRGAGERAAEAMRVTTALLNRMGEGGTRK
jgi:xanthine dehydrogenase accessory factor